MRCSIALHRRLHHCGNPLPSDDPGDGNNPRGEPLFEVAGFKGLSPLGTAAETQF